MIDENYHAYKYLEGRCEIINSICEPLEKYFNVGFYYTKIFPDGKYLRLGNNLEWERFYLQNFHTFETPSLECLPLKPLDGTQEIIPFLWPEKPISNIEQLVYQFGFWDGISFSRINIDSYEAWTIYSLDRSSMMRDFFASQHKLLDKFISFFNNQVENLVSSEKNHPPIFANFKNGFIIPKTFIHSETQFSTLEFMKDLNSKNRMFPCKRGGNIALTSREIECLSALIYGKTTKEAAQALNISNRTVESHINNIKCKTGYSVKGDLMKACYKFLAIDI
jgi:DNA-binding CsgD family transcriptional regulator